MNKIKAIIDIISKRDYLKTLLVFIFLFSCFGAVYFFVSKLFGLDDQLFHIRFAEIVREKGFSVFKNFHWIYFSKISLNQSYLIYYNFLFYLALIPFTFIKSSVFAIKLYGVIVLSLSFTTLYYFLLKINIKKPFYWVIIFLALTYFGSIQRFLTVRPFTLTPALLILELYLLYKKNYWGVFLLSLLYFYWHAATFFLPLAVAVIFITFEKFYGTKTNIKLLLVSFLGVALSFVGAIFFGFFGYMRDITFKVFYETVFGNAVHIVEGMEVYPLNFFDYMRLNIPITILFISAVVFEIYQYIEIKRKHDNALIYSVSDTQPLKGALFFLSLAFFLGNFLSQRNTDYYVFFSAAYIAVSFNEIISYVDIKNMIAKRSLGIASIAVISYLFAGNLLLIFDQISKGSPIEALQQASNWIKNNTDKNEIIFNPTWDWFTQLFYYNPDNYYITGLEPRFLYDYDSKLYWAWWNISNKGFLCLEEKCDAVNQKYYSLNEEEKKKWQDEEAGKIAEYIKNTFHSRFIITSNQFVNLNLMMKGDMRFEKVFTDNIYGIYIYKIN